MANKPVRGTCMVWKKIAAHMNDICPAATKGQVCMVLGTANGN